MKIKIYTAFLGLFCLLGSLCANAEQSITVTGSAEVSVTPDVLTFQVYIEEKGALLSKLNRTLEAKTEKVIDVLLKNSVAKQDIQSLNISVHPWYERENNQSVQKGFVISRQINVVLHDFAVLDGLMDRILRVGVSSIGGFRHSVKDQQSVFRQALSLAVENAKLNALAMTKVANKRLGEVISLIQTAQPSSFPMQRTYAMAETGNAYSEGQMTINASVQVEFALHELETQ